MKKQNNFLPNLTIRIRTQLLYYYVYKSVNIQTISIWNKNKMLNKISLT